MNSDICLKFLQERDYFTHDNLGIEPACCCQSCKGCKDCSWMGQSISQQEAFELDYIERCVNLEDNRFQIQFPVLVDPTVLANNYAQAVKIIGVFA